MSFSVGIIGVPNVGKSTLFKSLTKKEIPIAPRPFTTINPNVGIVPVPDERLEKIAQVIKPEKITPTIIEFIDIAGLVKGAHKGEGLGNQFLAQIRNCDAILEVVRTFKDEGVENVLGELNPEKEIEIVKTELLMKDFETLEKSISKLEKREDPVADRKQNLKKLNLLKKIKEGVSRGKLISEIDITEEEELEIKEYQALTAKPILYILNTDNKINFPDLKIKHLVMNLKEEVDISELSKEEKRELGLESQLDRLIVACYDTLNLITFFTVAGGKEVKAWTLTKNSKILNAAKTVHSDFKEKFIRAEVVDWQKLVEAGSWPKGREKGWIKAVGKDYLVQDGEVVEFKI